MVDLARGRPLDGGRGAKPLALSPRYWNEGAAGRVTENRLSAGQPSRVDDSISCRQHRLGCEQSAKLTER